MLTRMHSSRMCTVRCSGRLLWRDCVCPGGCLAKGQWCLPGGVCPDAWGGCLPRGCLPGGCLPRVGVCPWGVVSDQLHRGGGVCQTPPVNRLTDVCENITFPQLLLRTVIITLFTDVRHHEN